MPIIRLQNGSGNSNIHYEFDPDARNLLGEGGMGRVFRGIQVEEGSGGLTRERDVAIKLLFEDLPEHAIKRARREASIRIKHDNLVEMIDFVEAHENYTTRYHVVSELLNGVNLDDLLDGNTINHDGSPNPTAERLLRNYRENRKAFVGEVFRSILSGITALHDAGYIHRDIDPSNIMVTSNGKIKLIDFGIAKRVNELGTNDKQLTSSGQFLGKTHYAAPELILGDLQNQNSTTDVYSLGITLFQLCTGHLPFKGSLQEVYEKQLHGKMPLSEVADKELRKIIDKATQKDQKKRYQSASEFRVDIDKWMNGGNGGSMPELPWKKIGLAAAGVAIIGCIVYFIATREPRPEIQPESQPQLEPQPMAIVPETPVTVVPESDMAISDSLIEQEYPQQLGKPENPQELLAEAIGLLNSSTRGKEGFAKLMNLVEKGDYDATFLLSRLYFNPEGQKGVEFYQKNWDAMRRNCGVAFDLEKAHRKLMDTYDLDKERARKDPTLLYEMCCDFLYKRGVETTKEQKRFAKGCYETLLELTKGKSDELSVAYRNAISGNIKQRCDAITTSIKP